MNKIHDAHEPPDFSLVLGGPHFQLLLKSHLATPALNFVKRHDKDWFRHEHLVCHHDCWHV